MAPRGILRPLRQYPNVPAYDYQGLEKWWGMGEGPRRGPEPALSGLPGVLVLLAGVSPPPGWHLGRFSLLREREKASQGVRRNAKLLKTKDLVEGRSAGRTPISASRRPSEHLLCCKLLILKGPFHKSPL